MPGRLHLPLAAALLLGAAATTAQPSGPPGSLVDFLVFDRDGRPVSGLTAVDIELTENGQQLAFTDFREVGTAAPNPEPRRFVIIVNRRGAEAVRVRRARAALGRFASEQLSDGDEAMLVAIGPTVEVLQDFAPGGDRLRASLDGLSPLPHGAFDDPRHLDGRGIWDLLGDLGAGLRRVPGRKIVILMSVDQSADVRAPAASRAWTFDQQAFLRALSAFNGARAAVHGVDLADTGYGRRGPGWVAERQGDPLETADWYSARGSHPETDRFEGGLDALAAATGGATYRTPAGFDRALTEIGIRNRLWYELAWNPADANATGSQGHSLDVRVRGRDDLEVVMRRMSFPSPERLPCPKRDRCGPSPGSFSRCSPRRASLVRQGCSRTAWKQAAAPSSRCWFSIPMGNRSPASPRTGES